MEYTDRIPSKTEIYPLYSQTGWCEQINLNPDEADTAIRNSFAVVSVYEKNQLNGFGRVLSDGVAYATIHDVMVLPKWQGLGVGREIIRILVHKCEQYDIRCIHLFAAKGSESFYHHLGFVPHPYESPGMVYEKVR